MNNTVEAGRDLPFAVKGTGQRPTCSGDALLETDTYNITTTYDALGRVKEQTNADGSTSRPQYHLSGRLNRVTTRLRGEPAFTEQVSSITYNPKGQRMRITYGNGTRTDYTYEATTFRLKTLVTTRTSDSKVLQNISYTYDPTGNITLINDSSIATVFSNNQQVEPKQKFTYDALYRLTEAEGREHTALNNPDYYKDTNAFKQSSFISITDANDSNRLANYTRRYTYDKAGNMLTVQHIAANSARSFTRTIRVDEDSNRWLPANMGNNLTIGNYYDANGNIKELETLQELNWNYRDNISSGITVQRPGGISDGEFYMYDAAGQRVRKKYRQVINAFSTRYTEKVYVGNVEVKRIWTYTLGSGYTTTLRRTTLNIMDDARRIARVYNWTIDSSLSEVDSSNELYTNMIYYQYGNHLDSASLELSTSAQVISYEEYFAYGDTSFIAGNSQKGVKIKDYRYTGKEKDDVTGLYYYGARYYASWLGRWMSADPLFRENASVYDRPKGGDAEEQKQLDAEYMQKLYSEGLNLYGYVGSNPILFNDPTGHLAAPPIVFVIEKLLESLAISGLITYSMFGNDEVQTDTKQKGKSNLKDESENKPSNEIDEKKIYFRGLSKKDLEEYNDNKIIYANLAREYRNKQKGIAECYKKDFSDKNAMRLHSYSPQNPPSPYVGVTEDIKVALEWATREGSGSYTILVIYTNKAKYNTDSDMGEMESLIIGAIDPFDIIGTIKVDKNTTTQEIIDKANKLLSEWKLNH